MFQTEPEVANESLHCAISIYSPILSGKQRRWTQELLPLPIHLGSEGRPVSRPISRAIHLMCRLALTNPTSSPPSLCLSLPRLSLSPIPSVPPHHERLLGLQPYLPGVGGVRCKCGQLRRQGARGSGRSTRWVRGRLV